MKRSLFVGKKSSRKYLGALNYRTAIAVSMAIVATWVSYRFNLIFNLDLTLISVAVVFPLVFTLGSAFQRREKALEHLGRAKGALSAIKYYFSFSNKIQEEEQKIIKKKVEDVKVYLLEFLCTRDADKQKLTASIQSIQQFINDHKDHLGRSVSLRVYRLMRDVIMGVENAIAIKSHRTPHSIRAYCELFIYVFPFFYAPTLIKNIQFPNTVVQEILVNPPLTIFEDRFSIIIYALNMIISFFLIILFNIQDQIENPFDQDGLDDILLENYLLDY